MPVFNRRIRRPGAIRAAQPERTQAKSTKPSRMPLFPPIGASFVGLALGGQRHLDPLAVIAQTHLLQHGGVPKSCIARSNAGGSEIAR